MRFVLPSEGAGSALQPLMQRVARSTRTFAPAADGTGTALLVGERWVFAGSNVFTRAVDRVQYGLGEGPCLSAVSEGVVVRSGDLGSDEHRWPGFTAHASDLALRSVVSAPMVVGDEVIGSLNLYSRTAGGFEETRTETLEQAAVAAAAVLSRPRLLALAETAALALADAARNRAEVDLAVGLLMDRYTLSAGHAVVLIGQLARHDGVGELDAARSLLSQDAAR